MVLNVRNVRERSQAVSLSEEKDEESFVEALFSIFSSAKRKSRIIRYTDSSVQYL